MADDDAINVSELAAKLHVAIKDNAESMFNLILERFKEHAIEICLENIRPVGTSLHVAAATGRLGMLKTLLEVTNNQFGISSECDFMNGHPRLNVKTDDIELSMAPLHLATFGGHFSCIELLLNLGANVNQQDSWLRTSLHIAASQGLDDILGYLVRKGGELNVQDLDGRCPLYMAGLSARSATIQTLLGLGADPNTANYDGETTLHLAAKFGLKKTAENLIANGAIVNAKTLTGETPLMSGLKSEWNKKSQDKVIQFSRFLILREADVNEPDLTGMYPIHISVERGYEELSEAFMRMDLKMNVQNDEGQTALHIALQKGYMSMARKIMNRKGTLLNIEDHKGRTCLHIAATKGNTEIIRMLVKRSVRVEMLNENGQNALHMAVKGGHLGSVEELCVAQTGLNVLDSDGRAPLHIALIHKEEAIAKMLIERGVDVNIASAPNSSTPLHIAASKGLQKSLSCLISHDAVVNRKDKRGSVPLHRACMFGQKDIVKILLENSSNVDVRMGRACISPLMIAIEKENINIIKMLLDKGANVNLQSRYEYPLHKATKVENATIVRLLLSHESKVNSRGCFKQTALHCCAGTGELEIADILMDEGADLLAVDSEERTPLDIAKLVKDNDDMIYLLDARMRLKAKFEAMAM
ncbi:unnamed protein product [Owenia fusiformis]|uniref:Uncharacterized protein n=1 Tax=Owenia fusiformis TaxID=6347 RepID=A0A8J1TUS0_OWEFU|nr:unnamed protein product [Owenia fusiformis]